MIQVICLLGAVVVFLALAFVVSRMKSMQEKIESLEAEQAPTSLRSRESKVKHLDLREDIVKLNRRVEQLEIEASERVTLEIKT